LTEKLIDLWYPLEPRPKQLEEDKVTGEIRVFVEALPKLNDESQQDQIVPHAERMSIYKSFPTISPTERFRYSMYLFVIWFKFCLLLLFFFFFLICFIYLFVLLCLFWVVPFLKNLHAFWFVCLFVCLGSFNYFFLPC
jgi:hypothetical protein